MPTAIRTYQERGHVSRPGCDRLIRVLSGCCDFYNAELEAWRRQYQQSGRSDSLYERMKAFTLTRSLDPFWESVSVDVGRGVLIRAETAKQAFYRRCKQAQKPGFPRFKPRNRYRTIELAQVTPAMVRPDKRGYVVRIKQLS